MAKKISDKKVANAIKKAFEKREACYMAEYEAEGGAIAHDTKARRYEHVAYKGLSMLFEVIAEVTSLKDTIEQKKEALFFIYQMVMVFGAYNTKVAKEFAGLLKDFREIYLDGEAISTEHSGELFIKVIYEE